MARGLQLNPSRSTVYCWTQLATGCSSSDGDQRHGGKLDLITFIQTAALWRIERTAQGNFHLIDDFVRQLAVSSFLGKRQINIGQAYFNLTRVSCPHISLHHTRPRTPGMSVHHHSASSKAHTPRYPFDDCLLPEGCK